MSFRTCITKSRSGHYSLTLIDRATTLKVTIGKLDSVASARFHVSEAAELLAQRLAARKLIARQHLDAAKAMLGSRA
jgi:hypothetical protein